MILVLILVRPNKCRKDPHIAHNSSFPYGFRFFKSTEKTYVVKYHLCNILTILAVLVMEVLTKEP